MPSPSPLDNQLADTARRLRQFAAAEAHRRGSLEEQLAARTGAHAAVAKLVHARSLDSALARKGEVLSALESLSYDCEAQTLGTAEEGLDTLMNEGYASLQARVQNIATAVNMAEGTDALVQIGVTAAAHVAHLVHPQPRTLGTGSSLAALGAGDVPMTPTTPVPNVTDGDVNGAAVEAAKVAEEKRLQQGKEAEILATLETIKKGVTDLQQQYAVATGADCWSGTWAEGWPPVPATTPLPVTTPAPIATDVPPTTTTAAPTTTAEATTTAAPPAAALAEATSSLRRRPSSLVEARASFGKAVGVKRALGRPVVAPDQLRRARRQLEGTASLAALGAGQPETTTAAPVATTPEPDEEQDPNLQSPTTPPGQASPPEPPTTAIPPTTTIPPYSDSTAIAIASAVKELTSTGVPLSPAICKKIQPSIAAVVELKGCCDAWETTHAVTQAAGATR